MQREVIVEGNGEFIDEEMMVQIGGGDPCEGSKYDDIEQEGETIIIGKIVDTDVVVSPAQPLHRLDLTDILAFLDEKLGSWRVKIHHQSHQILLVRRNEMCSVEQ